MKIKKTIVYLFLILQLAVIFTPSTVSAQPVNSNETEIVSSVVPKVDDIRWQYKTVDHVLYRRLFNYSTNTPLSDWEIVP